KFAVLAESHGASKLIVGLGIRRFDVSRLSPGGSCAREEVHGACVFSGLVVLLAVDALGAAIFNLSTHGQRIAVAAKRQAGAEPVFFARIRRLDESLLCPGGAVANKNVHCAA